MDNNASDSRLIKPIPQKESVIPLWKAIFAVIVSFSFPTFMLYIAIYHANLQLNQQSLIMDWIVLWIFIVSIVAYDWLPRQTRQKILQNSLLRYSALILITIIFLTAVQIIAVILSTAVPTLISKKTGVNNPILFFVLFIPILLIFFFYVYSIIKKYQKDKLTTPIENVSISNKTQKRDLEKILIWLLFLPNIFSFDKFFRSDIPMKTKLILLLTYTIIILVVVMGIPFIFLLLQS